jgi:hypothetical protein
MARAPVSKTGGCRFESCHSCHQNKKRSLRLNRNSQNGLMRTANVPGVHRGFKPRRQKASRCHSSGRTLVFAAGRALLPLAPQVNRNTGLTNEKRA